MKVVHIGDSDGGGGAANAMSRLHESLRQVGVESQLLVRNTSAPQGDVETIVTRGDSDELFPAVREAVVRQYVERNRTSLTNTHFSVHVDGADVSHSRLVAWADVVHLHWTASILTPADVRSLFGAKPVVWTLHDLEPLTGGCHFPAGCEGYVADCADCPQLLRDPFEITATTLRDKKMLWDGERPTFIAPSRDIAERARRSAVAKHARASVVHIPHGIDVDVFRPRSKAAARRALGLPVGGLYVLCGSNYNAETRKGLRFLNRVLGAATVGSQLGPSKLRLLTVGEPKLDLSDVDCSDVVQLGRVSVDVMPSVYAAADIFLHPAVEDNFPCMVLEALSCGVPAIAFDIGGVCDIVQDEVCGRLVPAGDELAMATALAALVRDRHMLQSMSGRARAHVVEQFGAIPIARKHAELYDLVAESRTAPRAPARPLRTAAIEKIFPRWSTACVIHELALAHERASGLAEESRAKSERIGALEHEAAVLALDLADQSRQVQEKEAELNAIQRVAEEREAAIGEQRAEIELVHGIAAERRMLIDDLNRVSSERIAALERELTAIHEVAEERKTLAEKLHASAASQGDLLAKLGATIDAQRKEIEMVHRAAAERQLLIEDLHRAASGHITGLERDAAALARSSAEYVREVQAKEAEITAIHEVAGERKALAEQLHASAASIEALAARLQGEVLERDGLLVKLRATIEEQRAEMDRLYGIAAERADVIDRLSALADATQ